MSGRYAHETAAQPDIDETDSTVAATAIAYERTAEYNVTQIHQESVSVTYARLSSSAGLRYAELSTSGYAWTQDPNSNPIADEFAFQKSVAMQKIYRDLELSLINGTFQESTGVTVSNLTRGLLPACTISTVDASSAAFSKALLDQLLLEMAGFGADFGRPVIFCTAADKQRISNEYSFVPMDRNVGGSNISRIETDFGVFEVQWSRFVPAGSLLVADMSKVNLVVQPVPGLPTEDGIIAYEQLAKTGAAFSGQLYAQCGLDYTSKYYHGSLTSLAS